MNPTTQPETPETRAKLANAIRTLQAKGDTNTINQLVTQYKAKYTPTPTPTTAQPGSMGRAVGINTNPDNITNLTGGGVIAKGLGQAIANKTGTQDNLAKANDQAIGIQTQLLAQIKTDKAQGKNTTRLETALKELTQHIQDTGTQVGQIGNQNNITTEQVVGD